MRPRIQLASLVVAMVPCLGTPRLGATPIEEATARDGLYAVLETSLGVVVCRLEFEKVPVTVGNFVGLAEGQQPFVDAHGRWVQRRFYDGTRFHRVVPGFVVQGGCPVEGGEGPGYGFLHEFDSSLRHDSAGVLSMASSRADDNGSQFFITLAPAPHLNDQQSVFGHVVLGFAVLEAMDSIYTAEPNGAPPRPIVLQHVGIERRGTAAQEFDAVRAFARQSEVRARRDAQRRARVAAFRARLEADRRRAQRSRSGLLYLVIESGQGRPPQRGDRVALQCTGYIADDGQRFWSTEDGGEPLRAVLGRDHVIKAWEEAFSSMRRGEKRRLIVPPDLGYGWSGHPAAGVPAGATLVFDVELLDIERR